jgi:hypothetical protein
VLQLTCAIGANYTTSVPLYIIDDKKHQKRGNEMAKTWKILLINIETGQESAMAISAPSRKEARKQFFATNQNPYIKLIQVRKVKV